VFLLQKEMYKGNLKRSAAKILQDSGISSVIIWECNMGSKEETIKIQSVEMKFLR